MPELGSFVSVPEMPGLFVAHNRSLRCTAIRLKDHRLCLFSPVAGLSSNARTSLANIGEVAYLLAPNHYHNKGLLEYQAAYPAAALCAPDGARTRLEKVTGLKFMDLSAITKQLPAKYSFIEPAGLKTGEVWLRAQHARTVAWCVVDAFAGEPMTAKSDTSEILSYLKTFPKYGLADPERFSSWVKARLERDKPGIIVPCHGAVCAGQRTTTQVESTLLDMT